MRGRVKQVARAIYHVGPHRCSACGHFVRYKQFPVLWKQLIAEWELTPLQARQMDEREGYLCRYCMCSARVRLLSKVLLDQVAQKTGKRYNSVAQFAKREKTLRLAEINSLGKLHTYIAPHSGLFYSEYGSKVEGIPSEDVCNLSYGDKVFDFVLNSDTLEHVPDFDMALSEIRRVLKPDGVHLFTIPILFDRYTRIRAKIGAHGVRHLLPASYHGAPCEELSDWLVFNEFGADVLDRIRRAGFIVELVADPSNDLNNVIISRVVADDLPA